MTTAVDAWRARRVRRPRAERERRLAGARAMTRRVRRVRATPIAARWPLGCSHAQLQAARRAEHEAMSSPPPPPPCVLLSLPLPPLDASCVRARAAVLSGGSSESSASDEAELADLVRAWTFAQPVPCCTCRTAHWRTRLARETNQKQMRVLNALSTVLVRAQDDEERRRARRSQQPAAEETNSESKSASAQTPGRESLFSLLATLLRSYVRDLDWSPSVSREEGLWSLPGVFGHVPVPPLSSSMATHRSAIRDALAHLDSLTINGLGLTAPLKQARHFTRDGRLVTGVNDDLFSEVLALLRGSAIGSATYAHASPAPIDVVDGSTSNGNGTAAEAVAILAPSVLPSPLLVEDEASSWLRFADEAEDVPMLPRTTSSRRSRRDRRRAAASEDADVVESKRRRAAAASDTHADEEEDVVMLSQAPQAAAEAELRVADALRDVMHVQPNLPSSGSTSDASSRRSSHESTSSAAAAASASAWLEQWEAEVTAQSADHMTFPLFDDSDADDEGLRSFSQLAAESVAEEERHRAAEMASVRNAEPQETEGGSAVPMEIDAKDGSVAAPASTGTVPAPSPPLPSPPPAAASASPSPAPASSSTSPPAAVGSSAFLAQLASVRKALVSKLSIGAVYPLIELTVQALLTARASSKTAGTTTAPSLAPSQILAKLRVNPRLTSVSASLRLLFDHATQWRGLASVSEFESACVAMRFADLTLPALFVFLLAYLDDTVSGSRARAVLAQGMVERLKTIKDEPVSSRMRRPDQFASRLSEAHLANVSVLILSLFLPLRPLVQRCPVSCRSYSSRTSRVSYRACWLPGWPTSRPGRSLVHRPHSHCCRHC